MRARHVLRVLAGLVGIQRVGGRLLGVVRRKFRGIFVGCFGIV